VAYKVQQQARPQAGRHHIIDALGTMRFVQCFDSFQLDHDLLLHQQVGEVSADDAAVTHDLHTALLRDRESGVRGSSAKAFSYTFSRKPAPSALSTVNAQPMMHPDRPFCLS
jgi:hypothetical protein